MRSWGSWSGGWEELPVQELEDPGAEEKEAEEEKGRDRRRDRP